MAVNKIFRELAIAQATKQPQMVDSLLEEAPIVAGMPMQPSTHGFHNIFEEVTDVTGAGLIDIDDELPTVDANTELKQKDLSILGGTIFVGEDKAMKFGGASSYFASKEPLIMRKTGEDLEKSIVYNNLRAYAIEQGKAVSVGGTSNVNFSILAVTWTAGEMTGLYDPNGYGDGKMFDVQPINGGNLFEKTVNGKTILGYGVRYKSTLGIQTANSRYISALVNIDLANDKKPTGAQIDKMLIDARQNTSTVLYMHPIVLAYLFEQKASSLQVFNSDTGIDRRIITWNGTPIVTSYNFLNGTEANVTLS